MSSAKLANLEKQREKTLRDFRAASDHIELDYYRRQLLEVEQLIKQEQIEIRAAQIAAGQLSLFDEFESERAAFAAQVETAVNR